MSDQTPWYWDGRRYHDRDTGRYMGSDGMVEMRDTFVEVLRAEATELGQDLVDGRITMSDWVQAMRDLIKTAYTDEYIASVGGRSEMTPSDWGRLGAMDRRQYEYLDRFAAEIAAGTLSPAQISARAALYMDSATQAFERGKASRQGVDLPAYPGDGQTQCRTNCKCHWEFEDAEGGTNCTWVLEPDAEHCDDCVNNSHYWSPLFIPG